MTSAQRRAVSRHRRRQKRRGVVRVEVRVAKTDAAVVRALADALVDPKRASLVRAFVRDKLTALPSFKEVLEAMPAGLDLDGLRDPNDFGRDLSFLFDDT